MGITTYVASQSLNVLNPKRHLDMKGAEDKKIFPYYAGYSFTFADSLLQSMRLGPGSLLLDPWNGSGTSTMAAATQGIRATGFDLNPAMVVVAKASLVSNLDIDSLKPLGKAIALDAYQANDDLRGQSDPLEQWFAPSSARSFRAISNKIFRTLVKEDGDPIDSDYQGIATKATPLAAFFYVSLFRAARRLLLEYIPSNPTWIKKPAAPNRRKMPSAEKIRSIFLEEAAQLVSILQGRDGEVSEHPHIDLRIGNAESMDLATGSVDAIITSPPYCTRIDYAVATSIELAVLGCSGDQYDLLRRTLTGTSTVPKKVIDPIAAWGGTCNSFLDKVAAHESKASKSYYLKSHIQYFDSLNKSINEISRVLRPTGRAVLVVQDSYYKDVLNDVPKIVDEMASQSGLRLERRENFVSLKNMARINRESRKYGANRPATESVLSFRPI
ncbi:DNA methylase [Bordetella sp. H567]|uniref:DNA methylase n=1 Tax=Bordetella sp. H567 TaxID=1697043 RepID=UPI000A83F338|nr:DNA methylase [Bordetella sp. H567]